MLRRRGQTNCQPVRVWVLCSLRPSPRFLPPATPVTTMAFPHSPDSSKGTRDRARTAPEPTQTTGYWMAFTTWTRWLANGIKEPMGFPVIYFCSPCIWTMRTQTDSLGPELSTTVIPLASAQPINTLPLQGRGGCHMTKTGTLWKNNEGSIPSPKNPFLTEYSISCLKIPWWAGNPIMVFDYTVLLTVSPTMSVLKPTWVLSSSLKEKNNNTETQPSASPLREWKEHCIAKIDSFL